MVLHLLGKKSWNVYNSDNVERVRRDETEAQAREQAEEERMQDEDSIRRIAFLRGEKPPPLTQPADELEKPEERTRRRDDGLPRKRRRLRGEDDTVRDIRYAREDAQFGEKARQALLKHDQNAEAPLLDHAGHLQLIPAPDEKAIRKAEKNAEAEAEKAKKRKREEDQYMMKFSNAAGYKEGMAKPWYAGTKSATVTTAEKADSSLVLADVQQKDVWGNEDLLRKERERNRISGNDPFAAMQQAQRQLKQSERDRNKWNNERAMELEELRQAEDRKRRREKKRGRRDEDEGSLVGFSLDAPTERRSGRSDHHRHNRHGHHRRRSRSRRE